MRRPVPGLSAAARSIAVVVVLLLLAAVGLAIAWYLPALGDAFDGDSPSDTSSSSTSTSDTGVRSGPGLTDPPGTPAEPVAGAPGASVDFSQVADDPRAREVATMFAHFYGAINNRDYDKAMRRYDPHSQVVDTGSAKSRESWTRQMSTTRESGIALTGLSSDGTYTLATMSFRSHQNPGYGPASNPDDTCDDWTITYQLTHTKGYRIVKAPKGRVSYSSC